MPDEIEWNFDIDDGLLAVAYVEHGLTEREVHPDCPELAQAVRAALLMRAAVPFWGGNFFHPNVRAALLMRAAVPVESPAQMGD